MNKQLKYSVIIPHYNSEYLLRRTLDSIPNRRDIQVVVVDDLSTEHSIVEISKELKYSDVQFIFPGKKVTSGGARNIGLDNAKGEYILFADSDDYFSDNAFQLFDKYSESSKEFYQFRAESFLEESGEIGTGTRVKHYQKYYQLEDREGLLSILTPWAKLIRRDFIEEKMIRFSEVPPNHGDDMFFSTQVATACGDFEFCKEIVYLVSQGVVNSTNYHDETCYIGLLRETIKCTQNICTTRAVNLFSFFKDIRHKRWIYLDLQLGSKEYSKVLKEYLNSLPWRVKLWWKYQDCLGKSLSPQLHFSSSRNIDISYVLRKGKRKKLIVNFNDFGLFDESSTEGERYPYFFVNSFRKTRQSILDLRDFWGKYGVYYYQHEGDRIDKDINECIENAMRVLGIPQNNVLLFGIGKGATAALHFAKTFEYKNCIAIAPDTDAKKVLKKNSVIRQILFQDILGEKYTENEVKLSSLFAKEYPEKTDTLSIYYDADYLLNRLQKKELWIIKDDIKRIITSKVLTF